MIWKRCCNLQRKDTFSKFMTVLHPIIRHLTHSAPDTPAILPLTLPGPTPETAEAIAPQTEDQAQRLNAAFLILLTGPEHP